MQANNLVELENLCWEDLELADQDVVNFIDIQGGKVS
ncbi:hypothetical protein J2Z48_000216 [Croceifilum oryzae]|uniref:Uncharacterized protein n=1 Tax=Croceifilum oryzae TaxID=1553429 RepID=A0AAJ1TC51_9BACL|nr:hypothetical protein [Croceifilum oryzae]